jgi:ATP-dependent DNA helicase RecG
VFYRAGVIEKWGTGTINILDWYKENRNPAPKWEVRDPESIAITFFPVQELYESDLSQTGARPGSEPKSGPKLKPKSGPKSLQEKVLELLEQGPLFKSEIATHLGQKSVSGRLKKVFQILLGENLIAYTIPDKPRSRLQKYKLVKKPEK